MRGALRRAAAGGLCMSAVAVAPPGDAHLRFPAVKAERWLELRLAEEPIRIGYRIGFGAALAAEVRKRADRDGDFEISAAEGNAALDARSAELLASLSVCTGAVLEEVSCRRLSLRDIERVEAEGWAPEDSGHLHFSWTIRLGERATEIGALRFEDDYSVSGVEISDVQIDRPAHTPLLRAGDAGRAEGVAASFNWIERLREPGPRVVIAAWAPPRARPFGVLLVLVLALLATFAAWTARRRSRRSEGI